MLRYVVSGCAGSGTRWASQLFTALGSRCGHQRVYRSNRVAHPRQLEGDSSFFAAGRDLDLPGLVVVRLERDPLHVVRSIEQMGSLLPDRPTRDNQLTTDYIASVNPWIVEPDDRLGRILRFVAMWDSHLPPSSVPLRVDAPPAYISDVVWQCTGRAIKTKQVRDVMDKLGQRVNSHGGGGSSLTWTDIEAHPDGALVTEKARSWGFL